VHVFPHRCRRQADAILVGLDLLRHTDAHGTILQVPIAIRPRKIVRFQAIPGPIAAFCDRKDTPPRKPVVLALPAVAGSAGLW
jgi:hypothetical protein